MESELELNDVIQEMHVIATVPELYHILVDLNTVTSLMQLVAHENTGKSAGSTGFFIMLLLPLPKCFVGCYLLLMYERTCKTQGLVYCMIQWLGGFKKCLNHDAK